MTTSPSYSGYDDGDAGLAILDLPPTSILLLDAITNLTKPAAAIILEWRFLLYQRPSSFNRRWTLSSEWTWLAIHYILYSLRVPILLLPRGRTSSRQKGNKATYAEKEKRASR